MIFSWKCPQTWLYVRQKRCYASFTCKNLWVIFWNVLQLFQYAFSNRFYALFKLEKLIALLISNIWIWSLWCVSSWNLEVLSIWIANSFPVFRWKDFTDVHEVYFWKWLKLHQALHLISFDNYLRYKEVKKYFNTFHEWTHQFDTKKYISRSRLCWDFLFKIVDHHLFLCFIDNVALLSWICVVVQHASKDEKVGLFEQFLPGSLACL